MEEKNPISITKTELDKFDQEYRDYSVKAHKDPTPESDYNAALRAPAAFLKKPSNLELCFDKILFHLDEAYRKSTEETDRLAISRVVDDMFHNVISIIRARIEAIEKENAKSLFKKISESAENFIKNLGENSAEIAADPIKGVAKTAAPEVGKLTLAFFDYLSNKWELGSEESCFYNQLANVYQKVLDSKSFSTQFGLIRNTFTTNKEGVLKFVSQNRGLTAAQNLLKFDKTASETQESARIILHALIEGDGWGKIGEWEKGADFLHAIQLDKLANYQELKADFLKKFKECLSEIEKKDEEDREPAEKELLESYPTVAAIKYRINADNDGYKKHMSRRNLTDIAAGIGAIVFLTLLLASGIFLYQSEKDKYVAYANNEETRIANVLSQINSFVLAKDFRAANRKTEEITWTAEKLFFSSKDEDRIAAVRQEKTAQLLDAMLAILAEKNTEGLGEANYKYVNQELLPAYTDVVSW